jgi:hypothetical protein
LTTDRELGPAGIGVDQAGEGLDPGFQTGLAAGDPRQDPFGQAAMKLANQVRVDHRQLPEWALGEGQADPYVWVFDRCAIVESGIEAQVGQLGHDRPDTYRRRSLRTPFWPLTVLNGAFEPAAAPHRSRPPGVT